jgi:hypothetical protein
MYNCLTIVAIICTTGILVARFNKKENVMTDVSQIKNPTTRKVKNRGFTPIAYHNGDGVYNGWIYKETPKFTFARFPALGRKKLEKSELRYVRYL